MLVSIVVLCHDERVNDFDKKLRERLKKVDFDYEIQEEFKGIEVIKVKRILEAITRGVAYDN